ncbi:threonine synthase [Halovivax sp.]|uniref:threonine synthase n=1 Tax=Halovivax sp. TaxID=1935978 RepID=UPI0025B8F430|nr:threonine synthase [Halovivax sp.]
MPSDLTCPACDAVYDAGPDEPWRCACGHALEFVERPYPEGEPLPFSRLDTSRGLWTFFEFLPIEEHVTFHEGFTPLVEAPSWDVEFKLEYVFPTGSFKDRGATTTLSRAAELGVEKVIEDSSGNAGASIATYAARAGLPADIYVPDTVKQSKLMAIQRAGARPVRVEGSREDVTAACLKAVEGDGRNHDAAEPVDAGAPIEEAESGSDANETRRRGDDAPYQRGEGWYASHAWNPAFYAGTMTFAFEVAAQRDWSVPDALVLPIGHGTLFLGAYRGFELMVEAGITDRLPRLLGVQSVGYDPIVEAVGGERVVEDDEVRTEIADGIQISEPARGSQIVDAIEATDATAVAVGEGPVETALDRLHREGFYVEPTCAVAPAALAHFRERGLVEDDEDVVVPLTGSGLKTL